MERHFRPLLRGPCHPRRRKREGSVPGKGRAAASPEQGPEVPETNYMEKFDFSAAMDELEAIAAKVEDPQTGLADIDKYIARSEELISGCREYLRTSREKVENLGK